MEIYYIYWTKCFHTKPYFFNIWFGIVFYFSLCEFNNFVDTNVIQEQSYIGKPVSMKKVQQNISHSVRQAKFFSF